MCEQVNLWIIDLEIKKKYQQEGGKTETCVSENMFIDRVVIG
jgi:hypothetical protein